MARRFKRSHPETVMRIEFRRTGQRRYAFAIHRAGLAPVEFQAPGHDASTPHDLVHMIVEHELGLAHGIFGVYAAGGELGGSRAPPAMADGVRLTLDNMPDDERRAYSDERLEVGESFAVDWAGC